MNYEKIKNDLISEVRLTKNQAEVFLLVTLKGQMSANEISKSLDISIDDALETSQKLVEFLILLSLVRKFLLPVMKKLKEVKFVAVK